MLKNVEDFQKLGKDNLETCMKQFDTVSKGWQVIATDRSGANLLAASFLACAVN